MSAGPIFLLVLFATALVLPQTYGGEAKETTPSKKVLAQDVLNLKTQLAALSASLDNKRCESGGPTIEFKPHDQPTVNNMRTHKIRITFSKPFNSVPMVIASLNYLDIVNSANTRVAVEVSNVATTGFDVGLREWHDSYTWGAKIVWIACTN